jgi:threonine aldolase
VAEPGIRRSLYLHAPLRRMPHKVLRQVLEHLPEDTPPDGPHGPVALLERRIAGLLGTPAALFFPTGTMAQQVALRVHAERRGRFAFAGHPQCHLAVHEQQGHAVLHGLRFHPLGDRNSLFTPADLDAVGERLAALVIELPQRDIGGRLPDWETLTALVEQARDRGAAAHLDGARLWEAQPYYDRPHAEIAGLFDTAYVSLYKGLQGARGAVLAGDEAFLVEAAVWRQRLGGKLPDAWPLAAVALVGLDELLPRMAAFRDHAVALAAAINADGVARTVPDVPLTPLFHVHLPAAPADVDRAHAELLAETGTQLYSYLRSAPDPGRCSFEITVGENAADFTPDEVASLVRDLVTRSAART